MTSTVTKVPKIVSASTEGQGVDVPPINRTYAFFHKTSTASACRRWMGSPCPWGPGLSKCSVVTMAGIKQSQLKAKRMRMKQRVVAQAAAKSHAER